jgi:hypothetical protein
MPDTPFEFSLKLAACALLAAYAIHEAVGSQDDAEKKNYHHVAIFVAVVAGSIGLLILMDFWNPVWWKQFRGTV